MAIPFSRRALLGALGAGATSGAAAEIAMVGSRDALARTPPADGARRYLDEGGRSGAWAWRPGDFAAAVAADPLDGLHLAHATVPPARGAWLREWDGAVGRPEWFGARADTPSFDNQPAIQAALDLCPAVQLGPGSWHTRSRLLITRAGTRLFGSGITQTDQGPNPRATQIVCDDPAATILQVGVDDPRQPERLVETVQLRDFTVRRGVAPAIPASGLDGPIGVAMRWCVNCHVERVFSIDSARGWHFYGTIENYVTRCSALRGRAGTSRRNDHFIGFHLDYGAPLAANGGNASLYFDHCRAFAGFGEGTPSLDYSAGLRTDGGWVDLYIHAFETGLIQYGIDGHGDAYDGGGRMRTEDLIITNCVLDPGTIACIRLQTADTSSAVQIAHCYCASGVGGASVVLADLGGSITLTGNQFISGSRGEGGVSARQVNGLRLQGNIHTKLQRPIRLERVTHFHLADTVHALDAPNQAPAIELIDCAGGTVDCIVNGRAGAHGAGVALTGAGNRRIEVACTGLEAAAFAAGKLASDGHPVAVAGAFGDDCLARGIMT